MKYVLIAAVLLVLGAGAASAGEGRSARGLFARTATVAPRSASPIPVVAKLQPVVGSVQRTGHFTNPFTHKAKYANTVYNPVSGQFGTSVFRR